jgi:uncharacterized DUF497 family protein
MNIVFEWDEEKNAKNIRKHGVSFKMAEKVFYDPRRFEMFDIEHSIFEDRLRTVGFSGLKLLTVVFTERDNFIRIISARKADKNEEEEYFYGYS